MLKVAIWNFKGGTNKSGTAHNVAAEFAHAKLKTVAIDLDGQRSLSFMLGMDGAEPNILAWLEAGSGPLETGIRNLSLVPGAIEMFNFSSNKDLIGSALKRLIPSDVVLMDCPPSLGYASVQAVLNADRVLMPTLSEPAALKGLSEAISLIREENPNVPIDVLRCRYRQRLVLSREADDLLIEGSHDFGFNLLHTTIPENIAIAESVAQQVPVRKYDAKSIGAKAYRSLAKELMKTWGLK